MSIHTHITDAVRAEILAQDLTIAEVARRYGVHPKVLRTRLGCSRGWSLESLERIAACLAVEPARLLAGYQSS